jgi:diguanylate cyclase (GGDEF)-like protein
MAASDHGLHKIAKGHFVANLSAMMATFFFVILAGRLLTGPEQFRVSGGAYNAVCGMFLALALILFSWQRARQLRSELKQARKEAHTSATTDYLTGLLNRREFTRLLRERHSSDRTLALLDLDQFKMLNDVHGHLAGDEVLKRVGQALQTSVDTIVSARLGGDEFAFLLEGDEQQISETLRRLKEGLSSIEVLPNQRVPVAASIGLTRLSCLTPEEALRKSDIAMYSAKRAGGGRSCWFMVSQEQQLLARAELEHAIRTGIEEGQFVPFFQPQMDVSSGKLIGFEVLARWQSPELGLCLPDVFLDIAEEAGLLPSLSMSVMEQALTASKGWPGHLKIAVNIAPSQLKDEMLACRILEVLTRVGFPPSRLDIELTESSLLHDQAQASALIRSLKNVGVQLSLDDFGTGYASLTQLQSLPFDHIKIDKSFIARMIGDNQTDTIVRTITGLGQQLKLPVTAEGVESLAALERLREMGCESAQGWLFGKAESATDVSKKFGFAPAKGNIGAQRPRKAASGKR